MRSIFVSYAKEDAAMAQRLYRDLNSVGLRPWLDSEDLLGGQLWEDVIEEKIKASSHVLVLISKTSVDKRGFFQKEIRQALEIWKLIPSGEVFIIPVRLDDSKPRHSLLDKFHWIDLFPDYPSGVTKLWESIIAAPDIIDPPELDFRFLSTVLRVTECPYRLGVFGPAGSRRNRIVIQTEHAFRGVSNVSVAVVDLAKQDQDHGPVPSLVRAVLSAAPTTVKPNPFYKLLESEDLLHASAKEVIMEWVRGLLAAGAERSHQIVFILNNCEALLFYSFLEYAPFLNLVNELFWCIDQISGPGMKAMILGEADPLEQALRRAAEKSGTQTPQIRQLNQHLDMVFPLPSHSV